MNNQIVPAGSRRAGRGPTRKQTEIAAVAAADELIDFLNLFKESKGTSTVRVRQRSALATEDTLNKEIIGIAQRFSERWRLKRKLEVAKLFPEEEKEEVRRQSQRNRIHQRVDNANAYVKEDIDRQIHGGVYSFYMMRRSIE